MAQYLELRDIRFTYHEESIAVWDGLSCHFQKNTINLLLGPSGSGKSSLLYLIDGLIPNSLSGELSGEILLEGESIIRKEPRELAHRIGLVFQDPDTQFCAFYVEDELAFGMENLCVPPSEMDERIDRALTLVGLEGFRKRAVSTLSGGQKQKLAIASALVMDAELLLLDEPSALLDAASRQEIMTLLQALVEQENKTILLVEHNLDEVLPYIGHVAVLTREGRVALNASAHEVFTKLTFDEAYALFPVSLPEPLMLLRDWLHRNPNEAKAQFCRERLGVSQKGHFEIPYQEIAALIASLCNPSRTTAKEHSREKNALVMEARALSFRYPKRRDDANPPAQILSGVDFAVHAGEWVAIAGANGAGKTTLLQILFRVLTGYIGEIRLDGTPLSEIPRHMLYQRMGLLFQNPEWQFVTNRVEDELLFSLRQSRLSQEEKNDQVTRLLRQFHLEQYRERSPFLLSQGEKRRLSVACMLLTGQRVLFFDEPTYGQDSETAKELLALLESLQREGVTIVTVTHDMGLVCQYADRVLLLSGGSIAFDGAPETLFAGEIDASWRVDLPPILRFSLAIREFLPSFPLFFSRNDCYLALTHCCIDEDNHATC